MCIVPVICVSLFVIFLFVLVIHRYHSFILFVVQLSFALLFDFCSPSILLLFIIYCALFKREHIKF